jgi:hypothetical protein
MKDMIKMDKLREERNGMFRVYFSEGVKVS